MSNDHVASPIKIALKFYKEIFFLAKKACDNMNTNLNGKISFDEFRQFCLFNPTGIDFISRLTIGPYPPSQDLQQVMMSIHKDQMPSLPEYVVEEP